MEPNTLALIFLSVTNQFALPEGLVSAVCFTESNHKVHVVNKYDGKSPSFGLCQVKLATARMLGFKGHEKMLMNPGVNAFYSAKYLSSQMRRYKGNVKKAVASYNSGSYKEDTLGRPINSAYVRKVFTAWVRNR